jgi:hypothetical protein
VRKALDIFSAPRVFGIYFDTAAIIGGKAPLYGRILLAAISRMNHSDGLIYYFFRHNPSPCSFRISTKTNPEISPATASW